MSKKCTCGLYEEVEESGYWGANRVGFPRIESDGFCGRCGDHLSVGDGVCQRITLLEGARKIVAEADARAKEEAERLRQEEMDSWMSREQALVLAKEALLKRQGQKGVLTSRTRKLEYDVEWMKIIDSGHEWGSGRPKSFKFIVEVREILTEEQKRYNHIPEGEDCRPLVNYETFDFIKGKNGKWRFKFGTPPINERYPR
jgi:hypothetical protein